MKKILYCLGIVLVGLIGISAWAYFGLGGVSQSHVQVNVPDKENFDKYLSRDLNAYFSQKLGEAVEVRYELMRDQPTQSGLAYPKYYAWISAKSVKSGQILSSGAVRIAAREKTFFEVTDYVSTQEIRSNPASLDIFPEDVAQKIKTKANI